MREKICPVSFRKPDTVFLYLKITTITERQLGLVISRAVVVVPPLGLACPHLCPGRQTVGETLAAGLCGQIRAPLERTGRPF